MLRVGYRPLVQSVTVAGGEDATVDFALEPAPVQLDEVVSTATGEQRKLEIANAISTIDVAAGGQALADHRVHQSDLGPGAGRPGAQERRHHRHRDPDPDPRLQQRVALQRAALLHRRRPVRELGHLEHARHRWLRRGQPRKPEPLAHQRPQPRRHRQHRDREGPGGRDAVRHPGLERRRPHHHQARLAGPAALEPVQRSGRGERQQHLSAELQRPGRQQPRARRLRRLLHPPVRARRGVHPDLGLRVLAAREQGHPPAQDRLPPAARRQRLRRQRPGDLLPVRRLRERGRGLPAAEVRGRLDPEPARVGSPDPDPAQRAREAEPPGQRHRQPVQERRRERRAGLPLEQHPLRRERQQLPDDHRQRRGQRRGPRGRPRLVLHPGPAVRGAGQAGRRALHGRAHGELAAGRLALDPGHVRLRHREPGRRGLLPHRPGGGLRRQPGGRHHRQPIPDLADLGGPGRHRPVPALTRRRLEDVGRRPVLPRSRQWHVRQRSRPHRRLVHHRRRGQYRRLAVHRRVPLRRRLRRGGDRPQAAPVRDRRPSLRRQQRLRQGLQRHDLPQGQRLVAGV